MVRVQPASIKPPSLLASHLQRAVSLHPKRSRERPAVESMRVGRLPARVVARRVSMEWARPPWRRALRKALRVQEEVTRPSAGSEAVVARHDSLLSGSRGAPRVGKAIQRATDSSPSLARRTTPDLRLRD